MRLLSKRNLIAASVLLLLDFAWIWGYMGERYAAMIPRIQGSPMMPNAGRAAAAYALMVLGLVLFVMPNMPKRASAADALRHALVYGGLFGLVVYGVYDFTAGAVLRDWDMQLALVDVLWGMAVYATAAFAGASLA